MAEATMADRTPEPTIQTKLGMAPAPAGGETLPGAAKRFQTPTQTISGEKVGDAITYVDGLLKEQAAQVLQIHSARVIDLSLTDGEQVVGVMRSEPPSYRPRSWHSGPPRAEK